MKKILLSMVALLAVATSAQAQENWKMVITHADGTKTEILTSEVQNVSFVENIPYVADANVDQIVIKELYNGGCPKDEASGAFQFDKSIILYNNRFCRLRSSNIDKSYFKIFIQFLKLEISREASS